MKRTIKTTITLILCLCIFACTVCAQSVSTSGTLLSSTTYVNADGSYIVEEIIEYTNPNTRASTKSGSKTATYYTSSNKKIFAVTVTGTFSYSGSSATAESASATVTIYNSSASYVTKSAYTSGRTAYASGTVKYYGLNYSQDVALSCSNTGVLS